MTYTFRLWWVRPMRIVWDFGDGTALACRYPHCFCVTCEPPLFAA